MEPIQDRKLPTKIKATFVEVFGQFATKAFWKELVKTLFHEAVAAFFVTLGGTLVFYGKQKRNKDIIDASSGGEVSPTTARAFGGYTPSSSFQSSFPTGPVPGGDARFPGFGSPIR